MPPEEIEPPPLPATSPGASETGWGNARAKAFPATERTPLGLSRHGAATRAGEAGGASGTPNAPAGADPEDHALRERVLAGDHDAFARLVEKFHRRVAALVRRYVRGGTSALEDHAQEVFLRVYRGLPSFEGGSSLGTWIHRIALNYLVSDLRKRRATKRDRPTLSIDAPIDGTDGELRLEPVAKGDDPSGCVFDRERGVAIRRAMAELEEDLQRIVLLREIEGLSYEEIAAIVDIPIGTVRSRLHRARGILQERLRHLL